MQSLALLSCIGHWLVFRDCVTIKPHGPIPVPHALFVAYLCDVCAGRAVIWSGRDDSGRSGAGGAAGGSRAAPQHPGQGDERAPACHALLTGPLCGPTAADGRRQSAADAPVRSAAERYSSRLTRTAPGGQNSVRSPPT